MIFIKRVFAHTHAHSRARLSDDLKTHVVHVRSKQSLHEYDFVASYCDFNLLFARDHFLLLSAKKVARVFLHRKERSSSSRVSTTTSAIARAKI